MTSTVTKQDRVKNYLMSGRTISQDSAYSMFNVANIRATISDLKETFRSLGYTVNKTTGRSGETRYGLTQISKTKKKRKTKASC